MSLGLPRGTVRLVRDHAFWAEAFEQEKSLLLAALGDHALEIQHIGSTAIRGIDAKPILDIMLGLADLNHEPEIRVNLEQLEYLYRGEQNVSGRVLYVKGSEANRTHHLHVTVYKSNFWSDHIAFRDYLNLRPNIAQDYHQLKHVLAAQYPHDREAYTNGKKDFIERILSLCL